jgi:hypothetical protein
MTLRPAGDPDIDQVLDLWQRAAENATRPPDSRSMVEALLTGRLPPRHGRRTGAQERLADAACSPAIVSGSRR